MSLEVDQRRAHKTTKKLKRGGFEPPAHNMRHKAITLACDGCGETFDAGETVSSLTVSGIFDVQLHQVCYVAWLQFKP